MIDVSVAIKQKPAGTKYDTKKFHCFAATLRTLLKVATIVDSILSTTKQLCSLLANPTR